jgi:hypothetical protein
VQYPRAVVQCVDGVDDRETNEHCSIADPSEPASGRADSLAIDVTVGSSTNLPTPKGL